MTVACDMLIEGAMMKMTRRYVLFASCSSVALPQISLAQSAVRGADLLLVNNSFSHRTPQSDAFRYTFNSEDLSSVVKKNSASLIVHHGPAVPTPNYVAAVQYYEGLPLFTSKAAGIRSLNIDDLRAIVSGRINNWKQLGGNDIRLRVAVRRDGIFGKAIAGLFARHKIGMPSNGVPVASYERLAEFGAANPGALLIGLRGRSSQSAEFIELPLDDKKVSGEDGLEYPLSNNITVLVRANDPKAAELGHALAETLREQSITDNVEARAAPMIERLRRFMDQGVLH